MVCAGGDCFDKKIESRDDWCCPWGYSDCSAQCGSVFQNPCMAAVLSERVISNQGATVKELDAE